MANLSIGEIRQIVEKMVDQKIGKVLLDITKNYPDLPTNGRQEYLGPGNAFPLGERFKEAKEAAKPYQAKVNRRFFPERIDEDMETQAGNNLITDPPDANILKVLREIQSGCLTPEHGYYNLRRLFSRESLPLKIESEENYRIVNELACLERQRPGLNGYEYGKRFAELVERAQKQYPNA